MTFVSYAQNFEDVLLWRALRHVEQGTYLDIGAHDPVIDSVSLAFYEAGWRGTHVEPIPNYAARLRDARPDEVVIEAAVSQSPGPLEFHEFPETGLSTGKAEIAQAHIESGFATRTILVASIQLDQLLERTGEVHWMKIDVEGMESDVLRSWGNCLVRPWVLVIEATVPNSQERSDHQWRDLVISRGYREVHFDGLSRYFVHEAHADLQSHFTSPPNIFDGFAIAHHHPSARVVRAKLVDLEQRTEDQAGDIARLNEEILTTSQHLATEQRERELALRHAHEQELVEVRLCERQKSELQFRREAREAEEALHCSIKAAEAAESAARAELTRFQERTSQLEDKLARADQQTDRVEKRLADAMQAVATAHQQVADACTASEKAQAERHEAELKVAQLRTEAEKQQAAQDTALSQAHAAVERLRSDLGQEIEHHRGALAEVVRLICDAVAEPQSQWQRIGEALGLARPWQAREALASWSRQATGQPQPESFKHQQPVKEPAPIMTSSAPEGARNPYLRANSLSELLSWHDVDFVRCAYVTVLGRQPDPEGESYYTDRIRQGHSKMQVLWQLRRSPEGPQHDPGIAGFDRALKRDAFGRLPILGAIHRLFTGEISESKVNRGQPAIQSEMASISAQLTSQSEQLMKIEANVNRLDTTVRSLVNLLSNQNEFEDVTSAEIIAPAAEQCIQQCAPPLQFSCEPIPTSRLSGHERQIFNRLMHSA